MKFCTKCGSPLNENFAFCVHCGKKIEAEQADAAPVNYTVPVAEVNSVPSAIPAEETSAENKPAVDAGTKPFDVVSASEQNEPTPIYKHPPTNTYEQQYGIPSGPEHKLPLNTEPYKGIPDKKGEYGLVATWYYFLMTVLYAIPVIGLIMTIVMSFGGTINRNKRAFARSVLIFKFIGILMLLALLILGIVFEEAIFDYVNSTFYWGVESWGDMVDML